MEENKEVMENKLSYEQLEQIAVQLQNRAMQAESRLASINMTTTRLNYLFKVLEYSSHFCDSFVKECGAEIVDLLENKEPETTEE